MCVPYIGTDESESVLDKKTTKKKQKAGRTLECVPYMGHETQIGSLVNGLNGAKAGWAPTKRR